MFEWIEQHEQWFAALAAVSLITFLVSLFVAPALIIRIPPDYFTHTSRPKRPFADRPIALRLTLLIAKNVLGVVLLLGGIAMLVLPGQGLLTMVIGFVLLDVPGKYRVERWLLSRRWIRRSIDWLRRRAGREPLILDGDATAASTDER